MSQQSSCSDVLLDFAAAAERLAVSERMVRRLVSERRLPRVKVGRHVRVPADAVTAYIAANTRPAEVGERR